MADAAAAIASTQSHVEAPSPEAKLASTDTTAAAKILNEHKLKAAAINILAILHDMASTRNMARAPDASQPINAAHSDNSISHSTNPSDEVSVGETALPRSHSVPQQQSSHERNPADMDAWKTNPCSFCRLYKRHHVHDDTTVCYLDPDYTHKRRDDEQMQFWAFKLIQDRARALQQKQKTKQTTRQERATALSSEEDDVVCQGGSATGQQTETEQWIPVRKGNKLALSNLNSIKNSKLAEKLSYAYANLPAFAADPPPPLETQQSTTQQSTTQQTNTISTFRCKAARRLIRRHLRRTNAAADDAFLDEQITIAEDERTARAKADPNNPFRHAVDTAHTQPSACPSILQCGRNFSHSIQNTINQLWRTVSDNTKRVRFAKQAQLRIFHKTNLPITVTYDSGADGHYISETDRRQAGLPILRRSTKQVGVANGNISRGQHVTELPIPALSKQAKQADTFPDFPHSLMSVGKTADDGMVSIFTHDGVTVFKEDDVLITCKDKPILIGVRDARGRYRIPLVQSSTGTWQPRRPSKKAQSILRQANSVYDLPNTEEAIKWMHAVCGFPVKSTWLKAVQAGNFIGWPLLTVKSIQKYYPETTETSKGHMSQTRKNVRSTKPKPFETINSDSLRGKKLRDVYSKVYDVRETIFSDQTGQFPTRSLSGNRYIMVLVEIDSSCILVEPMKSRKDAEMIRAYNALLLRLRRANIIPKKHVLDNEISDSMKNLIRDEHRMQLELVPPGCHRRNAAEVAIRNFKAHFLSVLAGVSPDFPLQLWDRLLPQTEITLNLLRQSNATPTISAYAHLNGPFDYNKMPLAPMGCNVQVHEKTDTRGTWAFHSVDGWYLSTSPEHYRTHKCHIKDTRSDRLSDTVHFQHKSITNPTMSPGDKLMTAIADCIQTIKGVSNHPQQQQLHDLRRLMETTPALIRPHAVPRVESPSTQSMPTQSVPRVATQQSTIQQFNVQRPITRSYSSVQLTPSVLPVSDTNRHKRRRRRPLPPIPSTAPAANTRSRTKALANQQAPPAARTRAATARHRPTRLPPIPRQNKGLSRLAKHVYELENDISQALEVMDAKTGNMLSYRQLMNHQDYRGEWSLSSANEFGRLANGVGNRIKKPSNTIRFIRYQDLPPDRRKDRPP
ncbi:predicted protein [Thalassiosira pseudonana CCMP1335]|uniref:Integrase catalytic domain-containing protein n=1 Tax=Thalassiosira pseudonana TaxID=35128 RepID=B8BW17_THAPS|nr:predicted protein [Thalassiosira pseudonana CCMP1335]EED95555.1 predicted protein [Thalassiosira pseudonana CCMP1335]